VNEVHVAVLVSQIGLSDDSIVNNREGSDSCEIDEKTSRMQTNIQTYTHAHISRRRQIYGQRTDSSKGRQRDGDKHRKTDRQID
jgi:hypothetical protein